MCKSLRLLACGFASLIAFAGFEGGARAADHGDAPNVAGDQGGDLGDTYMFLNPNDNTRVVIAVTLRGFIVPGEAVNFSVFDQATSYRFDIENTGDSRPDQTIEVSFSAKGTTAAEPQTATVKLSGRPRREFTAPTTVSTLAPTPNAPTVTVDGTTGISFFAGPVDDPFFFDIPAFSRFVASVRAGSPDPTQFNRGRDTFAGYNNLAIMLSVPVDAVRGDSTNNIVGVSTVALRKNARFARGGVVRVGGRGKQIDRSANPGINAVLIPFARKNEYNAATPQDDAKGQFADDLVAVLTSLGTSPVNIQALAALAIQNGDYVRVDVSIPNTGPGGGNNAEAGFPNGRRLGDDVIDTILTIIANGTPLGDNVDANDVPLSDDFPFFAPPQQPLDAGVTDDNTRN